MDTILTVLQKKLNKKTIIFNRPAIKMKVHSVDWNGDYDTRGVYVYGYVLESTNDSYPAGRNTSVWLTEDNTFEIVKKEKNVIPNSSI